MALYHKYRPQTLEEIKGNIEIVNTLKGLLADTKKMPHVFLFHGESGCGKTTFGRIIKNVLEVSDYDYDEINSSNFRGIDTARDIIKSIHFKPHESAYRIYLIDECHKLTNDAQNALLKPLEDTPEHVIFILCTTEPQKLIKAIHSRTSKLQVNPLSDREMKSLLRTVAKKEKESVEMEVLNQIITEAKGHPRAALQILEQVLNTEPEKRLEIAKQSELVQTEAIELCRALFNSSGWKKVSSILVGLKNQEPESIRRLVLAYASNTLLKTDKEIAGAILEEFIEPFYNSGFPGLVLACYRLVKS